ncbi:MAG: AMP-binding protein, partial [Myxococcota bacterium]
MSRRRSETPARISGSIVDHLRRHARERPEHIACRFLSDGERELQTFDYADLDRRARAMAARILAEGGRGERALLLLPPGPEYVLAFVGCLYAGAIPVPVYPPAWMRTTDRIDRICQNSGARLVIADEQVRDHMLRMGEGPLTGLRWLLASSIDLSAADDVTPHDPEPDDL